VDDVPAGHGVPCSLALAEQAEKALDDGAEAGVDREEENGEDRGIGIRLWGS
jgi:hypothetical protein